MTVLLTWRGLILARHRATSTLVQRSVNCGFEDADPVDLGIPADRLQVSFTDYLRNDASLDQTVPEGPLQDWHLARAPDRRSVTVAHDGHFLSAIETSPALELRTEANAWESFLPLADAEFQALRLLLASDWIIRSSRELVPAATVALREPWALQLGALSLDLRWQVPFELSKWPHRLTVLRDGWRVEEICRFRPLVFYGAFGNATMLRQFALSVRSLRALGCYHGPVAVMTEHPAEAMLDLLPATDRPRCVVLPRDARDRLAFQAARYTIADWPAAWDYQPILYSDTDIAFDADIGPMLRAIATSDRLAAPFEPISPLRSTHSVGAGLLQLDGCDPANLLGFNSGTIGIPNLASHAATLRLIEKVLTNHAALRGRHALSHGDQEVANYVAYKTGSFDTALLAPFVRVGYEHVSPEGRRGLVHFWGCPEPEQRAEAMMRHMRRLGVPEL